MSLSIIFHTRQLINVEAHIFCTKVVTIILIINLFIQHSFIHSNNGLFSFHDLPWQDYSMLVLDQFPSPSQTFDSHNSWNCLTYWVTNRGTGRNKIKIILPPSWCLYFLLLNPTPPSFYHFFLLPLQSFVFSRKSSYSWMSLCIEIMIRRFFITTSFILLEKQIN